MSKKGAAKPKDETTYEVRDIVLAKIRGFPHWPAQVVDPANVPRDVAKERPAGKKSTFYCVRFFPAGDHAWVPPKDLSKLQKHEIEAYINDPPNKKKGGDLLSGYQIALNPEPWEREMEAKREAAEEAEADEEVDELEGEEEADEDEEEQPAKVKKRKRESEGTTKTKAKPKKEKDAGEGAAKKKKTSDKADKPPRSKKNGGKSKETIESEDEGERTEHGGSRKKTSPPPTKKTKRDKDEDGDASGDLERDPEAAKVKELRHKLQRAFLGKSTPKPEDMQGVDSLFQQVEEFDISLKYLQYSKIGKVMRHIAALEVDKVPRDDEFKFKDRAQALVNKWHNTVHKQNGSAEPPASTANGDFVAPPPSAPSEAPLTAASTTDDSINKKMDESPNANANAQPAVGDTTLAESALGDVTMSEVAA
ncbi:Tudor/PWWP/MBT [Fomitiporia mediterranea MF3/22]|uniref:Tudor/PWWP/MBT n=1 Tax=Fomitiporia mediterranea (strain MF3/22) TaxID=694068 RepID=UPI0004408F76|nr:Tudor/PWWP/MBT [Fomitiporia mediterranea MF3/22]EJD02697.1 Tudor/PWWP/MBT [Fomitiporia mediterranea MF3/22]